MQFFVFLAVVLILDRGCHGYICRIFYFVHGTLPLDTRNRTTIDNNYYKLSFQ